MLLIHRHYHLHNLPQLLHCFRTCYRIQLVLAADFSDSSSDEDGDDNGREPPSLKTESTESTSTGKPPLKRSSAPSEIKSSSLGKQALSRQDSQCSNAASIVQPSSLGNNGNGRMNSKGVPTYDCTKGKSSSFGAVADALFDGGRTSSLPCNDIDGMASERSLSGGPLSEADEDHSPEMALQGCEADSALAEGEKKKPSEKETSKLDVIKVSTKTCRAKKAKPGNPVSSHQKIHSGRGKGGMMTSLHRPCDKEVVASPQDGTGHGSGASSVKSRGKQTPREKDSHGVKRQSTEKTRSGKKKKRKGSTSSKTKAKSLSIIENIFGSL